MAWCPIPLYNVHFSVGKGGKNHYNDVRLVQSLIEMPLRKSAQRIAAGVRIKGLPAPRQIPACTGECDELTNEWITLVQKSIKGCRQDGRVDPMPANDDGVSLDFTARGNTQYTLYRMLVVAYAANPQEYLELQKKLQINYMANVGGDFTYVLV
jgi:hypothetical protein